MTLCGAWTSLNTKVLTCSVFCTMFIIAHCIAQCIDCTYLALNCIDLEKQCHLMLIKQTARKAYSFPPSSL